MQGDWPIKSQSKISNLESTIPMDNNKVTGLHYLGVMLSCSFTNKILHWHSSALWGSRAVPFFYFENKKFHWRSSSSVVYTLCSDKIMLTKKKWLLFYKWIRKIGIKLPFARVKFCKFILKWSIYLTGFIIPSSLEGAGFFVGVAEKMINQSTCRIPAMTLLIIRKYTV